MRRLLTVLAATIAAGMPCIAHAATATGTLAVSVTVVNSCSVGASTMAFGNLNGSAATIVLNVSGTVAVTCTNLAPYNIGLDKGANGSSVTARQMSDGATHLINYSLFRDSSHLLNWGQTVGTDTVAGVGNGSAQSVTVYGQIPSQSAGFVNTYTDTVNITVTY
jgi:spore coat protein U-like protein